MLVLDDFHRITAPQIHNALAFLADQPAAPDAPGPLHPGGPALAPGPPARARQMTELRADDLRFTAKRRPLFSTT